MTQMNLFGEKGKEVSGILKREGKESAFGIDLGTTNSCISVLGNDRTEVLPVDGSNTMPSCVMWLGGDNFVVGKEAYKNRGDDNVIYSVKRLMGSGQTISLTFEGETREFEPKEISAKILRALVDKAKEGLYKDINDVVITVPAYFSDSQIKETLESGKMAGLNVLTLMKEPTAAALLFNRVVADSITSKTVLVYDLGGGTFDVSVVRITNTANDDDDDDDDVYGESESNSQDQVLFQVLGVRGDMRLGGDDVDDLLVEYAIENAKKNGAISKPLSDRDYEKLKLQIENYKKSGPATYRFKTEVDGKLVGFSLTTSNFSDAFSTVYAKTKNLIDNLLQDMPPIDQIIMVGGSTRAEYIQTQLQLDYLGNSNKAFNNLDPDLSVTFGAAVQAKRLKFGDDSVKLLDCLPMHIGILSNGVIEPILRANDIIPSSAERQFLTNEKGQDFVIIKVFQGISEYPEACTYLGELRADNLKVVEDQQGLVTIRLVVNSNGILELSVLSLGKEPKRVELVNILGGDGNTVVEKEVDMQLLKWQKWGSMNLAEEQLVLFKELLAQYEEGTATAKNVKSFISKNSVVEKVVVPEISGIDFVGAEDE